MALGQNYLGQAYLGQGFAGSSISPTATLQVTFSASAATSITLLPATATLAATFTASTSPLVIVRGSGTLLATFFTASVTTVIVPGAAARLTATFSASTTTSKITLYLPTNQSGIAHGPQALQNHDPTSPDFAGDPTTNPGHRHTGAALIGAGQASGGTIAGLIAILVNMGIIAS